MLKRLVPVFTAAAVLAAVTATSALAKGASEAMITGPGLGPGISLTGEGSAGGGTLMRLAEDAGFFPSVFATAPNPMLAERPAGQLGPRYTITYTMPGPTASSTSSCRISTRTRARPRSPTSSPARATSGPRRPSAAGTSPRRR